MILHRNAKWAVCIMGMSLCFLMGCKKDEIVETVTEPVIEEVTPEDMGEGTAEEAAQEEETSASVAQTEIDEETKNELTAELLQENQLDTSVLEEGKTTSGCTFLIPEGFEQSEDMPGMHVTKRYPIDASTIYYVALEQDVALQLMTENTFVSQAEANFKQIYEEDIPVMVDSFEKTTISGYPAFRIQCHFTVDDIEITQLQYVINADKSYVITYSQTGEYDRMEEYEASAATIQVEY